MLKSWVWTACRVMGRTGDGKTSFINCAAGSNLTVGHGLESATIEIQTAQMRFGEDDIILIDTPGFDDTTRSQAEILKLIAEFLARMFDENKLLDGVLYLHDITVNRMNGAPIKSYKLFRQLCGNKAMTHVIIVTTMWDAVSLENGERRMQELRDDYFDDALRHGVGVMRHYNTKQSADTIIAEVLNRSANLAPDALKIQREMVIDQKVIAATSAGQELLDQLDQATVKATNSVSRL
ncbi:hypothetical protein FOMPIDRAFT_1031903 [Fomitopsis schrenkii]|uniref:G domain-containing protein n=1 Tax=Fomitopsis schrenkii TaxID=2126942 RepID=S8FH02_FOMSC|nr:hypothetical protein FOMPIDRAFT_1031903 [Fomitopsis schrenkii]